MQPKTAIHALVASKNPTKVNGVKAGFAKCFASTDLEVLAFSVASGVPDMPLNDDVMKGAQNRLQQIFSIFDRDYKEAAGNWYGVSIESGLVKIFGLHFLVTAVAIGECKSKRAYYGITSSYQLPTVIEQEILEGGELGPIMDRITGLHDTKQKQGAVGLLSKGAISRSKLYEDGTVVSLLGFLSPELYNRKSL